MSVDPRRLASAKKWRRKNREAYRAIERRCYLKNREKRIAARRAYYQSHKEVMKAKQIARHALLKDLAYRAYGGYRCACCAESEPIFLCLDHVNGGGNKHRKVVHPSRLYFWLKTQGYPPGLFQVLCHNCNNAKKYGACPHQEPKPGGVQQWARGAGVKGRGTGSRLKGGR